LLWATRHGVCPQPLPDRIARWVKADEIYSFKPPTGSAPRAN
jgi:hypothetical protein